MAAIFQIRRGTSNISIDDGELYLNKGIGSIQFGSGSTPVTLVRLDQPNSGSLNIGGNITASNAYFSGDVAISGNLFLGNASNEDTITAGGEFTSNLIPNPTNTYALGSSTKLWKEVHATSISGAIAATNGIISGSAQIAASLPTGIVSGSSQINFTQINGISNDIVSASTDSTNIDFTITNGNISANLKGGVVSGSSQIISVLDSLNQFSSSINTATASLNLTTASLNTFTASNGNISLNEYTQSLKAAISLDTTNVTILGDLTVNGTTTQINSTQVNIGENILELNFGGSANTAGIYTKDATGGSTTSGSLLWDSTNDFWIAGKKDLESKLLLAGGDNILSSSAQLVELNSFTQSSNLRLNNLEYKSASVDISIANLNIVSSSVNDFTASTLNRLNNLQSKSSSIDIIVSNLQISSSNLNIVSASLNSYTASNDITNTNQNNRLSKLEESTSSLNTFTASVAGHISDINAWTGSQKQKDTTLENVTSSLNLHTQSLNSYTSSTEVRLDDLEYTASISVGAGLAGEFSKINQVTASLQLFTSSINTTIKTKLDTDGVISGSSQVSYIGLSNIPAGIISSSAQIDTLFNIDGIVSGSSQISYVGLSNIPAGIISGSSQITSLLPSGVISGSSQVYSGVSGDITIASNGVATIQANSVALGVDTTGNYMSDLTQGTGVTISHTPGEGSNATISIAQAVATTSDVQFGSLGVGGAASGVSGEIRAWGDITAFYSSDERLKSNIQPIGEALTKVNQISGNVYDWKEGFENIHSHTGTDIGVIAQEIEKVLPYAVIDRDNGYKAVNYEKIVPLLIEAIKELSSKIDRLENK